MVGILLVTYIRTSYSKLLFFKIQKMGTYFLLLLDLVQMHCKFASLITTRPFPFIMAVFTYLYGVCEDLTSREISIYFGSYVNDFIQHIKLSSISHNNFSCINTVIQMSKQFDHKYTKPCHTQVNCLISIAFQIPLQKLPHK